MVIIVGEAGEPREAAVVSFPLPLPFFPLLLSSANLIIELSLAVHLLHRFSTKHKRRLDRHLHERLTTHHILQLCF